MPISTSSFRTKTEFYDRDNRHVTHAWEIALDIGYSSVKLYSPNKIASFPSYAKRVQTNFQFAGDSPDNAILYRDLSTGQLWLVGEVAQDTIAYGDTSDSESSLYGRARYNSDMFLVIARTGIGISMQENRYGSPIGLPVVLQTGLPEKYLHDEGDLRESLSGTHKFALKVGKRPWKNYNVELSPSNIFVLSQPRGTLFSACMDSAGKFRPDWKEYLNSSVIVFDAGFGTLDIFPILEGTVEPGETYSDLGMKRVLSETSDAIRLKHNVDVPVPSMQKYLSSGTVRYVDRRQFKSREYPFCDLLEKASVSVCNEAVERMMVAIDLIDYKKLIVTGGTGEAWYNQIHDKLKDFDTLSVVPGNQNDNMPFIYANVRGYYYYRYNKLAELKR